MSETELQYWKRIADQRAEQWDAAIKREDLLKEQHNSLLDAYRQNMQLVSELQVTKQSVQDLVDNF